MPKADGRLTDDEVRELTSGMPSQIHRQKDVQDNTRINRGMKPRKDTSIAFPLNRMVGDCLGDRTHPLALTAGGVDAAIMAGAYKFKNPNALGLRFGTRIINELPIDWRKQCDEGERTLEDIRDDFGNGIRELYYPSGFNDWLK
jgi:hypothetical protein